MVEPLGRSELLLRNDYQS